MTYGGMKMAQANGWQLAESGGYKPSLQANPVQHSSPFGFIGSHLLPPGIQPTAIPIRARKTQTTRMAK
jgi:hypothetical protein